MNHERRPTAGGPNGLGGDRLASASILGTLGPVDREELAGRGSLRSFAKGEIVFCEGAPADSIVVLESGELKISTYSRDGAEFIIATAREGDSIGELGVLTGAPRSATVTAMRPSTALGLSRSVITEFVDRRPELAAAMHRRLADMVRRSTDVAADLVFLDLRQRVVKLLLEEGTGANGSLRITQSDLAARVGASRQRVNGCLQDLQREGCISIGPGRLGVVDPGALASILEE